MRSPTRRSLLGLAPGVALLVSACSRGSDAAAGPDTPSSVSGGPVNAVVATEGRRDLDIALALGLPLVGFPRDGESPDAVPRFDAELRAAEDAGAQQLFLRNEINLEAIAATAPDLVLGRDEDLADLPELSAIAPVIALGSVASDVDWRDDLVRVAEATGTQAVATELLARYEARLAQVRAAHADVLGSRVLMAAVADDGGVSLSGSRLAVRVLSDLGAAFSPAMAAVVPDGEADYSRENLLDATAGADLVVLVADRQEVPAPLQDARLVLVDKFVNEGGPLTALSFLDTLEELYALA